jgi:tRNA (cmo5U34)-methyltransferase
VNMAARIESLTVGGQILASRAALERTGDAFEVGPPITLKVKGRDEALTIFEVLAAREDPALTLRAETGPMREVALEADLWVLSGKSVVDKAERVAVTRLGKHALELVTTGEHVAPLQDVKVRLRRWQGGPSGWYAKVRSVGDAAVEGDGAAQRALVALTHEAELTLEERLRERLARVLSESVGALGAPPSGPRAAFLRQLVTAPVQAPLDREIATRVLVEMAAADGVLEPTERQFVGRFIGTSLDAMEGIMTREPLGSEELASVSAGPVRETILMLAWATALCDAHLAPEEAQRLAELAAGLHIEAERALELRGAAQLFLADAAYSIVWPAPEEEEEVGPLEDEERDAMTSEYGALIERWVPRYAELMGAALEAVPPELAPSRIVQLGCGTGQFAERLVERYPDAQTTLMDQSEELAERCRRRFRDGGERRVGVTVYGALTLPEAQLDLVVSTVALHGLKEGERRRLYGQLCRALRPGGVFVLGDVFFGTSPSQRAHQLEEWREAAFALGTSAAEWESLMAEPERYFERARLERHLRWLGEAGFGEVDCVWRESIWGCVVAVK